MRILYELSSIGLIPSIDPRAVPPYIGCGSVSEMREKECGNERKDEGEGVRSVDGGSGRRREQWIKEMKS